MIETPQKIMQGDKDVDARYKFLRTQHDKKNPMANGYRFGQFFDREQRVLLSAIDCRKGPFFDMACGSGLMLMPLVKEGHQVYGLDFNMDACQAALQNGITVIRGDAFHLPFAENSIGHIVNCQFLNQQPALETRQFILESARVLKPKGKLIILWRHANSLIHISAHAVLSLLDRFTGQPAFPQYTHSMSEIESYAAQAGLVIEKKAVTLPFSKKDMIPCEGMSANIFGASLFVILKKNERN